MAVSPCGGAGPTTPCRLEGVLHHGEGQPLLLQPCHRGGLVEAPTINDPNGNGEVDVGSNLCDGELYDWLELLPQASLAQ
eukprot:12845797-Alexandrium_andersonii.AAC.1